MFNFDSVETPKTLNRDFILSKITDAMIFGYYFGKFNLKNIYKSKFHKDNNPSTGFYISRSGKIIYNHLNDKEPKMDCFAYVQRVYNCSFKDAVKRIALDFGLIAGNPTPLADKVLKDLAKFDRTYKKDTKIHFVARKWDAETLKFWKKYGITKEELVKEGVYPIKNLYINEIFIPNPKNLPRYALTMEHKGQLLTKVYSPDKQDMVKWVNNISLDLPFGIKNLNKNALFSFTTKSVKDMIVVKKFLPAVIATQNESKGALSYHTIKQLNFLYPKHYLGWDNDETGLKGMEIMKEEGFIPLHVPVEYLKDGIKDFSDLVEVRGLIALERLFKEHKLI